MPFNAAIEGRLFSGQRPFLMGEMSIPNFMTDSVMDFLEEHDRRVIINTGCVARQEGGRHLFGDRLIDYSNGQSSELSIGDYEDWYIREGRNYSVFEYIVFTSMSKLLGRNFGPEARDGNFVALQDTVNVYQDGGRLMPMEKPSDPLEALRQARWLVQGKPFLLTTASIFAEVIDHDGNGRVDNFSRVGVEVSTFPLRFNIDPSERERIAMVMVMSMNQGYLRRTPGVISSASPVLLPTLEIGLWDRVGEHVILPREVDGYYGYNGLGNKREPDEWVRLADLFMSGDRGERMLATILEGTITGGDIISLRKAIGRVMEWETQDPRHVEMVEKFFDDTREMMGLEVMDREVVESVA